MRKRVAALLASAGITAVVAVWPDVARPQPPGQDIVGIYFDQNGTVDSVQTSSPWEEVVGYLVVKNLSAEDGLEAIAVDGQVVGNIANFCWLSLIGGFNISCIPSWVLQASPVVPRQAAIAILKLWFQVRSPDDTVWLYVLPTYLPEYDQAVYQTPGDPPDIRPLYPASGSYDVPVAVVNGETVKAGSKSWGAVKALYR